MKRLNRRVRRWILALSIVGTGAFSISFVDEYFEISKNLEIFTGVYKEVHTYYVDDVEPGKLMRTGIDAMLESLDPYTQYYSESETEDYRFQITGQYGGIGALIGVKGDYVIISEPYEGSPAHKAGLRAGDMLLEADGISLKGMRTDEVSKLLKGTPGTSVKVKILRYNQELTVELTREQIQVKDVPYYGMVNASMGYIRLQGFHSGAGDQVKNALIELKKNPDLRGVILDLRGNPGGLLHEAINVVNVFVGREQLVVSTKGKAQDLNREYRTLNQPVDTEIPLVVLVNRSSASASEIVSGTIQDLDRGIVVGERTFGKGLVQSTRPLKYGTQIKLTTQKYYTPSGRCIQALDYSSRNEDGSVGSVPDSLKKAFKTKNGRTVYDGGGIDPDHKEESERLSKIAISLLSKQIIFDYAVHYRSKHESIGEARDFRMSEQDWNDFLSFIQDKDYAYQTDTEKELAELKEKASAEGYYDAINSLYGQMQETLVHDKQSDVLKNKDEIVSLLEEEIVRHYYLQRGRFEYGFTADKEVLAAIRILSDAQTMSTLLKP